MAFLGDDWHEINDYKHLLSGEVGKWMRENNCHIFTYVFKLGKITNVEDQVQMLVGVWAWQWKNSWEIFRGGDPLQESLPSWSYNVESPINQIETYSLRRHVKSLQKQYSSLSSENQQIIVE
jgi:hypothetical protein